MNNEEIKQMIRELAESADAEGRVKSKTIRIRLDDPEEQEEQQDKKRKGFRLPWQRDDQDSDETEEEQTDSPASEEDAESLPEDGVPNNEEEESGAPGEETDFLDEEDTEADAQLFSVLPSNHREEPRRFRRAQKVTLENALSQKTDSLDEAATSYADTPVVSRQANGEEIQPQATERKQEQLDGHDLPEEDAGESASQEDKAANGGTEEPGVEEDTAGHGKIPAVLSRLVSVLGGLKSTFSDFREAHQEKAARSRAQQSEEAVKSEVSEEESEPEEEWLDENEADEGSAEAQLIQVEDRFDNRANVDEEVGISIKHPVDEAEKELTEQSAPETAQSSTSGAEEEVIAAQESQRRKLSLREALRHTPVEEADFASDADEFRTPSGEAIAEMPMAGGHLGNKVRQAWVEGKISKKHLIVFIGVVIIAAITLAAGVSRMQDRQKRVGVTADEGLTVSVESQPTDWTNSGEVILGIRLAETIQSITVNEESIAFSGTTSTRIQVEAESEQLTLLVVSDKSVYNAVVNLSRVDATPPTVTLSESNGQVTIDAQDERSGVQAVYYGKLTGLSSVPAYQLYTEPFAIEEGALYVYYAVDDAGNVAGPVTTGMESAQSITISDTTLSLFPGDTSRLTVGTVPENAFLNGLTYTSSDSTIAAVSTSGVITAMADGTAQITVSAEGLSSVVCEVNVRSQASVTISAVGDVTLGDDVNFSTLNSFSTVYDVQGSSYFFQNVRSIFEADDITFANLEGTLTDRGEREDKTYAFRGDPSYTQILVDGSVEAVTLANNHSSDYGEISLTDTEDYLTQAGIDYVIADTVVVEEAAGVKVGMIGIYTLASTVSDVQTLLQQDIDAVRRQDADVIVVAFHWGEETAQTPNEDQMTLAHAAVDYGADLVVGHHPHVIQGIEVYEGKYIVYSLGNFCFGGNSNPSDMDTMIFQETFTLQRSGGVQSTQVNVIPCSISSDSSVNNYQPTTVTGTEAQRIMEKINERSAIFGTAEFVYSES